VPLDTVIDALGRWTANLPGQRLLAGPPAPQDAAPEPGRAKRLPFLALGVVAVILVLALAYGLGAFGTSSPTQSSTATTSTSYDTQALSLISSALPQIPSGYIAGSAKQLTPSEPGLASAGYSLFSNPGGALANMTVIVFNSTQEAQRYGTSVTDNAKSLGGYSDATSVLTAFERYGACYGYAESDPEGGEYVANGVCTDGNVYIFVHLAATSSLASAESDMSAFMGAAYGALA